MSSNTQRVSTIDSQLGPVPTMMPHSTIISQNHQADSTFSPPTFLRQRAEMMIQQLGKKTTKEWVVVGHRLCLSALATFPFFFLLADRSCWCLGAALQFHFLSVACNTITGQNLNIAVFSQGKRKSNSLRTV